MAKDQEKSVRHHHHHHHHRIPEEPVPPFSWTSWEPDTQWEKVVPIRKPLKVVQYPFYDSLEDPTPEWAPNVILYDGHRHHHHHKRSFLRKHWTDNIKLHVYGTNPLSDTQNSGGAHFQ